MEEYLKPVTIEIDGYLANEILKLAKQGGFCPGLRNSNLNDVIKYILNQNTLTAQRKIRRIEREKEKKERIKDLNRSLENINKAREIRKRKK